MHQKINYHALPLSCSDRYPASAAFPPMRQLTDFIPLLLFFITYQMRGTTIEVAGWSYTLDGIFSATAVLMIATSIQVLFTWLLTREVSKNLLWLLALVLLFGGATLLFRDQTFIFWKPTVFNWGLALALAGSQFVGRRNLLERLLGSQLQLPAEVWSRLLWVWVGNCTIVGSLNLVVAYQFSEPTWVSYKLYSAIGFTVLLTLISALLIAPHLREKPG